MTEQAERGRVGMVRNWIMILGLSLTIAAFGCTDGGGGTAGSGGAGGTAGSGGAGGTAGSGGAGGTAGSGGAGGTAGSGGAGGATPVTDACLNAQDLAMVCMATFGDDYVAPCATDASGAAAGTSTCLQVGPPDGPGLTSGCADCYGNQSQCIRDNCVFGGDGVCFPPNDESPACLDCRDVNGCDAAAAECTGDLATECAT